MLKGMSIAHLVVDITIAASTLFNASSVNAESDSQWEAGIVEANGISIAYETFGGAHRDTVLLIGGTGQQLVDWPIELVEALLERGYRVIRFDNRDVGLSTKVAEAGYPDSAAIATALEAGTPAPVPYTLSDMAADAVGLMDALDVRSAHVVGASMGGAIAQLMAIDHPERVRSLVMLAADSGNPNLPVVAKPEVLETIPAPPAEGDIEGFIEYDIKVRSALGSPGYPTDEQTLRELVVRNVERAYEPAGLSRQAAVSLVGHLESAGYRRTNLARISVPSVVVQGTDDPLQPVESAYDLADNIPGTQLILVPGMGHDLPVPLVPQLADAISAAAELAHVHR